ncbi:hypothetical protein J6590_062450 [Homalodisca vitripennis]|nr:hypothetical protein J6590_062450 [Homalodisca vitripennis]
MAHKGRFEALNTTLVDTRTCSFIILVCDTVFKHRIPVITLNHRLQFKRVQLEVKLYFFDDAESSRATVYDSWSGIQESLIESRSLNYRTTNMAIVIYRFSNSVQFLTVNISPYCRTTNVFEPNMSLAGVNNTPTLILRLKGDFRTTTYGRAVIGLWYKADHKRITKVQNNKHVFEGKMSLAGVIGSKQITELINVRITRYYPHYPHSRHDVNQNSLFPVKVFLSRWGLEVVMHMGYVIITVSVLLMVWASIIGATQTTHHHKDVEYPPCFFNPLCTCSKAVPDLGIVTCRDVPLPRIPPPINSSKVFMLNLENNGMGYLEPHFLEGTEQLSQLGQPVSDPSVSRQDLDEPANT